MQFKRLLLRYKRIDHFLVYSSVVPPFWRLREEKFFTKNCLIVEIVENAPFVDRSQRIQAWQQSLWIFFLKSTGWAKNEYLCSGNFSAKSMNRISFYILLYILVQHGDK